MRYFNQPTVVFADKDGIGFEIKETRQLEKLNTMLNLKINEGDDLDEIATRQNIFGEDAEILSYKIFDHNAVAIVDSNYDITRIKTLKIPQV